LARRDTVWMGQIYRALGLSVSCLVPNAAFLYDPEWKVPEQGKELIDRERDTTGSFLVQQEFLRPISRREAYLADITYGTNHEFGFDYLRDNLAYGLTDQAQRTHNFAIIDEVDSILIDEARTPLIISAPAEESTNKYYQFAQLVTRLQENEDYNIDEKMRAATLTEVGIGKMEKWLGVENIYTDRGVREVHHIEQSLKAQVLFKKDRDYVVQNGEILIVDEFTGRLMHGRRYSDGLHQAIEAKEGVEIKQESVTMATITFQNYFRMYKKLAGMTGTAATEAEEFSKIYNLDVIQIPTNKPMVREDSSDVILKTEKEKYQAIVEEIKARHQKGQPVLVGTISIENNERLAELLSREGVEHRVLNAKQHEKEAEIIAQAGRPETAPNTNLSHLYNH
jgi:preprotein translocase subunit SecA